MPTRETTSFAFTRLTRTPQMDEIRAIVGDYGGVVDEEAPNGGRTMHFINPQEATTDAQNRRLVAYMRKCGFELVRAKVVTESRTEEEIDPRLLAPENDGRRVSDPEKYVQGPGE